MPKKKIGGIHFSDGIVDLFVQLFGWKMHSRLGRGNLKKCGFGPETGAINILSPLLFPRKGVACQERGRGD